MKKVIKVLAITAIAGLVFTGCCNNCKKSKATAARTIQQTVWQLVQFDNKQINAKDKYELIFLGESSKGRIAGVGECNRFFGSYEIMNAEGVIKTGPIGSTMMACLPGTDNIETEYFGMLEQVHLYQVEGNKLYLFVNNKVKAIFEATDKPVPAE